MSSAATSAAASCYGGGQVRGRAFMSGGLGNPPHRGDLVPIPDDPKINGLGAFPICCWDARPPQSAAKVVLGTHKVLASGEGGWVFGVLCVLGAPLCERVSMLRMPDPIHPDLPCLFACATVPALSSVVIPDACVLYRLSPWELERDLICLAQAPGGGVVYFNSACSSF